MKFFFYVGVFFAFVFSFFFFFFCSTHILAMVDDREKNEGWLREGRGMIGWKPIEERKKFVRSAERIDNVFYRCKNLSESLSHLLPRAVFLSFAGYFTAADRGRVTSLFSPQHPPASDP